MAFDTSENQSQNFDKQKNRGGSIAATQQGLLNEKQEITNNNGFSDERVAFIDEELKRRQNTKPSKGNNKAMAIKAI